MIILSVLAVLFVVVSGVGLVFGAWSDWKRWKKKERGGLLIGEENWMVAQWIMLRSVIGGWMILKVPLFLMGFPSPTKEGGLSAVGLWGLFFLVGGGLGAMLTKVGDLLLGKGSGPSSLAIFILEDSYLCPFFIMIGWILMMAF